METVFIVKNKKSPRDLGFEIMKKVASPGLATKRVLIKPNLTIKASGDSGIVTNPVFVEGIIDYLKKSNVKEIKIGEGTSAAPDNEMKEIYKTADYVDLSARTGVELINFNKDKIIDSMAKSILDFDVLINVPVLKTHRVALVTLGIKNLMGLFLPVGARAKAFHVNKGFKQAHAEVSEKIIDLYKKVIAKISVLTVIDGFFGREGNGFEIGKNKNMGIAIAGWNTVAVDTVSAYIMGFNPKLIYYLALAQKQKLGSSQLSKIKINGINPKEVRKSFKVITAMEEKISPHSLIGKAFGS